MALTYSDSSKQIIYEFQDRISTRKVAKDKINLAALSLYGFYRKTVYDSYRQNSGLSDDIKTRKPEFKTHEEGIYQEPLYHYSIAASLGAMLEWQDPTKNMHTYTAYEISEDKKHRIGFAHFQETRFQERQVVYIAQAGVETRGNGIGRHLMESILTHYPAETEFYIVTRVFNTDAITLYEKRLGFKPIGEKEIQELGYDTRYCGYRHISTKEELTAIKERQMEHPVSMRAAVDTEHSNDAGQFLTHK